MKDLISQIKQIYKIKLGREADENGLKHHYNEIMCGNLTIEELPKVIEASLEFHYLQDWRSGFTKTKDGFGLYVDPNDTVISKTICFNGEWEPQLANFFKKIVKKGMNVIDIGANIGYFTILFSKLVDPPGSVIAFEPSPRNFDFLKKNVISNSLKNVQLVQKAVSNNVGHESFFLSKVNFGDHRLEGLPVDDTDNSRDVITTEVTTLDDYLNGSRLDFCKIDAQGAEMKVLEGGIKTIEKNNDLKMAIEFSPRHLSAMGAEPMDFLKKIKGFGFNIYDLYNIEGGQIRDLESLCSKYEGGLFTDLYLSRNSI